MATYELAPSSGEQIKALAMGAEMRPRADGEGRPKLSPHGKPTYSSGVVVAREDGGQDRSITIAVCEPSVLPLGAVVRPAGRIWLTPYVQENGGRTSAGQSIVCDRLEAVTPARRTQEG